MHPSRPGPAAPRPVLALRLTCEAVWYIMTSRPPLRQPPQARSRAGWPRTPAAPASPPSRRARSTPCRPAR
eukprot:351361-Chlamydomonas_euryale.AAC.12